VSETKSPEALLQDALTAEQNKTKQLTTDLTAAQTQIKTVEAERNTAQGQAKTFEAERNQEREAHTKTKDELVDANRLVDQLTEQLSKPSTPQAHTATLGSGKEAKTYRFKVPQFHFAPFGKVVAVEVKNNSEILKALVAQGAAVIELVEAK
jgi:chromosome segregation ATPase